MASDVEIPIRSRDYWFKIVDFLQQNGALTEEAPYRADGTVHFTEDMAGVLDPMT